jgi:hypothetical protein
MSTVVGEAVATFRRLRGRCVAQDRHFVTRRNRV